MTQPVGVEYASNHQCPLCAQLPVSDKQIYGHPVCKKCYNGFMNRRQLAYVIDALITVVPSLILGFTAGLLAAAIGGSALIRLGLTTLATGIIAVLFSMKDGISGQSPGKMAMDVQVLDMTSGAPISWMQSAKRYCFVFLGLIPFVGPLAQVVIVLIIAFTLGKGLRMFDVFANTRVIWKKYANSPVFQTINAPAFEVMPMAASMA